MRFLKIQQEMWREAPNPQAFDTRRRAMQKSFWLAFVCVITFSAMLYVVFNAVPGTHSRAIPLSQFFVKASITIAQWLMYGFGFFYFGIIIVQYVSASVAVCPPSLGAARRMLFLKQGAGFAVAVLRTVFVAMTIALMIWWFVEFAPVLSLAVTIGIVGMSTIVQNCVPPFVLFLSASTTMQLTVQQKLVGAMMPLQVYCLLDCDQAISPGMAREAGLTSLRAPVHEHWRDVVAELMDIAPVVVLDARFPTPAVLEEARHILNTNVAFKSFFIVGDDGERPVLDAILLDGSLPSDCRATAVTEIELLQTLVAMKWSPERRPRL